MQEKDCFLVGTVFKLHGYKGDIKIYNEENTLFNYSTLKFFLIEIDNKFIPFFVNRIRLTKPHIILVDFEDLTSEEQAKKILKKRVFLPKELLMKEDTNGISEKQLIGYLIIDKKMGELGKISFVNSQTPQQLIYVNNDGKEFCFPMHKQFVKRVNSNERIMEIEIPEEFLNLN